jgi:hypothetical protein
VVVIGGRYWDRTSGPCRVKAVVLPAEARYGCSRVLRAEIVLSGASTLAYGTAAAAPINAQASTSSVTRSGEVLSW